MQAFELPEFCLPYPSKPFIRPAFHMPYASRSNPHLDATRAHATEWARAMGMLVGPMWTESVFEAMDFALVAALTHPDALAPELVNDWHVWGWFVDDLFVEHRLWEIANIIAPPHTAALRRGDAGLDGR